MIIPAERVVGGGVAVEDFYVVPSAGIMSLEQE